MGIKTEEAEAEGSGELDASLGCVVRICPNKTERLLT